MDSQFSNTRQDILYRFALRLLGNREDAMDVVQDVLEKLWKKRKSMEGYNSMEALSIKMTRDLCLDRLRQRSMKAEKLKTIKKSVSLRNPNKEYENMDLVHIVKQLIMELPEKQKMVIHLRDVELLEFEEISEILEIDIRAVRMNLSRARKSIKERLEKIIQHGL